MPKVPEVTTLRLQGTRPNSSLRQINASRTSGRSPRDSSGTFPPRSVHLQMQPGMRGGSQVVAATRACSAAVRAARARESSPGRAADVTLSRLGARRDMGIKGRGGAHGMPGALRRCLTSAALPCPLASPSFFPPKDAPTQAEPPCALSLPSPAFPPSAADVAGPLSSWRDVPASFQRSRVMRAPARRRLPLNVAGGDEQRREKLPRLPGSRRGATPRRTQPLGRFVRQGLPAVHNSGRRLRLPQARHCVAGGSSALRLHLKCARYSHMQADFMR